MPALASLLCRFVWENPAMLGGPTKVLMSTTLCAAHIVEHAWKPVERTAS
jgi:hypothetical protein